MKYVLIIGLLLSSLSAKAEGAAVVPKDSLEAAEIAFENYVDYLYVSLNDSSLSREALRYGLRGYYNLRAQGKLKDSSKLTIVDFSQLGNNERLYVIDLNTHELVWRSLVSHGVKSGGLKPYRFSNTKDSHQSSIGFFVTGQRWHDGRLGDCLQLYGKEYCNSKALERGIIIHAADYATCDFIEKNGVIGRSYGCPAVPNEGYSDFLNLIDKGTCYFIYYPDYRYKYKSWLLNNPRYLTEFALEQQLYL